MRAEPTLPPLPNFSYRALSLIGRDLRAFLTNYPLWSRYPEADTYHLTSQTLASLLLLRRPAGKVVVTVHDIFPYMFRDDPQLRSPYGTDHLYHRLAMAGLKRADHLIAVSQYTRQCVTERLGIAPEKITVVYSGIDHERFRPLPVTAAARERYALPEGPRYLIYVGSEDPRKNLATLVRALAELRRELPDVELIKVGRSHFERERQRLLELATKLEVRSAIHFLEDVSDQDLPLLYNLADLYVTPSLYEGFGFPVLEAMERGHSLRSWATLVWRCSHATSGLWHVRCLPCSGAKRKDCRYGALGRTWQRTSRGVRPYEARQPSTKDEEAYRTCGARCSGRPKRHPLCLGHRKADGA